MLSEQDIKERDEARDILRGLHFAVVGDEPKGIKGLVGKFDDQAEQITEIKDKLDRDHDLLWINRQVVWFWDTVKKPLVKTITVAIVIAFIGAFIYGGDAVDYLGKLLRVK